MAFFLFNLMVRDVYSVSRGLKARGFVGHRRGSEDDVAAVGT